jgi:thioredoxin 1
MTTDKKTIEVNDATFERRVLGAQTPVLLDFGADWCPPCKVMIPVLEELAAAYENRALVAKLDVDANPQTAAYYQVRNLPTLLILKNGQVVERIVGAVPKNVLANKLNAHL